MKITTNEFGSRVVHLDQKEAEVYALTGVIKDELESTIGEAAAHALAVLPNPDPAFVQYLSVGTLALVDGIIESMPYRRQS